MTDNTDHRTKVSDHGWLRTSGDHVADESGEAFVLRGVSLFWSQWMPHYYNGRVVKWLRDDWNVNLVRTAMAVNHGGYKDFPEREWDKITGVIDAAIDHDLYVIVDWHSHEQELASALPFFDRLSARYSNNPHLVYEIWNEPGPQYSWGDDIRPYHDAIIPVIRRNSPKSLIIAGTENCSQRVDVAALAPLPFDNIVYAVHFYAASHRQKLRQRCLQALAHGLVLMATEYGTCEATGDGIFDPEETRRWWRFLQKHQIGHCNWSLADKVETAAALMPAASANGGWPESMLTASGRLVRQYLRSGEA